MRQTSFQKTDWDHRFSHGGNLRKKRKGRHERPLSTKEPIHLVFKTNAEYVRGGLRTHKRFRRIQQILDRYSQRFFIRIEQCSVQFDHIHLLVRISRRSNFQNFLRVFAGQVSQRFIDESLINLIQFETRTNLRTESRSEFRGEPQAEPRRTKTEHRTGIELQRVTDTLPKPKLWKHRPFTRVVRGYRAYQIASDYVRLNELEANGVIPYRSERLRGLRPEEWTLLWA